MVAQYQILGRQVGSHYLAMATLGTMGAVSYYFGRSDPSAKKAETPAINAGSKDEESFIQEFIKNAEAEEKKEKAKAGH